MFDLHLDAQVDNWRLFNTRAKDPRFKDTKDFILERDNHQCQFCGFSAKSHMEVVNLNGNYLDNKTTNMVTTCSICQQCHFVDMVGNYENSGGLIVYLPEISQGQLNALAHVLFAAKHLQTSHQKAAKEIVNTIKLRSKIVEKSFAKGASSPSLLGRLIIDTPVKDKYKLYDIIRKKLRLLPDADAFRAQYLDWSKENSEQPEETK
jgi:intracellular multiplication protein IcmJ